MDLHGGLTMETRVEADFADGQYVFWLPMPQVIELERAAGASILTIEEKLRAGIGQDKDGNIVFAGGGGATVSEIRETIRLGLIGGNRAMVDGSEAEVGPLRAAELVRGYAYPARPLAESAALAWRILSAAIFGVRLKKKAMESATG
ncbi:gene transfer agent family protein [Novosphingobium sp. FSY-8]|uniref:Gene transfer agent family protein n=1 Tax=Novosphingobium ovatum TaxID=1908523 RepID=A0ABW9XFN6_9SPHN|nr:GTA-gp10 family protein [Novosphingobium ovatum]NBC37365.1 gene transfer agent family protein [Novosphingobium ovatum]